MALLFLQIIDQLLDVENEPCKPQYAMAADFPLVLYDCAYEGISWRYDQCKLIASDDTNFLIRMRYH